MIIEKIKSDQIKARKKGDKVLAGILTTLYSEAAQKGFDDGKRLSSDKEVIAVCKKFIKNIDETLQLCYDSDIEYEKSIISKYIPKQFTNEEIAFIINNFMTDKVGVNIGHVMKHLNSEYAGLFDAKFASSHIKSLLN